MCKRILITGAAGFIGFHMTYRLVELGNVVVGFDNFNDYYSPELKRMRANRLPVPVLEGDIRDGDLFLKVARDFKPTHLLHLAAQAGVRASLTHPHLYTQTNVNGFLNVLEVCRSLEIPLIYASSSSVYGNNRKLPFSTEDRTDLPANLYGATKKAKELMGYSYHHCYGIPITALRYFTVYGPWGRPDMAYTLFAEAIEAGRLITLYENMERDFTYIDDIVSGTVAAIDLAAPYEVFNLGNSAPVPVIDLIRTLEKHLGKRAEVNRIKAPIGEISTTFADIAKSKERLHYEPTTSLDQGIATFVDWFKGFRVD